MAQKYRGPLYNESMTQEQKERYLALLEDVGIEGKVISMMNLRKRVVQDAKAADQDFAETVEQLVNAMFYEAEQELFKRAVIGEEQDVYDKYGVIIGKRLIKSDSLLIFYLKAHDRNKYGDKQQLTGANDAPLIVQTIDFKRSDIIDVNTVDKSNQLSITERRRELSEEIAQLKAQIKERESIEVISSDPLI